MSLGLVGSVPAYRDESRPLEERVADLVSRLTVDEKLAMMASRQPAVVRLGIPEFHIGGEAAHGLVAPNEFATVFPQTQGLACTWDRELLYRVGEAISDEARALYNKRRGLSGLCLWAPTIDMERDPRWGRNEEAYGEDPILAGRLAGAYIRGMQGEHPFYLKTVPTPKHFYANNNEKNRSSCSASIDPRLKREYYLASFEMAVREYKVSSLMTSYNRINGIPAMLHPDLLQIVKGDWGLDGFIVCDGAGLTQLVDMHRYYDDYAVAAAESLRRGVDNFSDDAHRITPIVREAFDRNLIDESDLDRALTNVFRVRFRLGQFDSADKDPWAGLSETKVCSRAHLQLSREAARKSIVLLKNEPVGQEIGGGPATGAHPEAGAPKDSVARSVSGGADQSPKTSATQDPTRPILPLNEKEISKLAVIGPLAGTVYRDWYTGQSPYAVSPLAALVERLGPERVCHVDGSDTVVLRRGEGQYFGPTGWYNGTLAVNRQAGEAGERFWRTDFGWGNQTLRSYSNGCYLNLEGNGVVAATAKEVYAWYVQSRFDIRPAPDGSGASQIFAWDGTPLGLNQKGELAAVAPDKGAGYASAIEPIFVDTVENGIDAAVQAAADADAALVFVGNNPVLVAKEEIDRPSIALPPDQRELLRRVARANPNTVGIMVSSYPYALEGLEREVPALVYMAHGGPEGGRALADMLFGDSSPAGRLPMTWYTGDAELPDIFDYDIRRKPRTYRYYEEPTLFPFGFGLSYSRFDYKNFRLSHPTLRAGDAIELSLEVRNEGAIVAEEVVQLYAKCRSSGFARPNLQLLDFARLNIEPGEVRRVSFSVPADAFRVWDSAAGQWLVEESSWTLAVGPNSRDLRLQADFELEGGHAAEILAPTDWSVWSAAEFEDLIFDELDGESCVRTASSEAVGRIFLGVVAEGRRVRRLRMGICWGSPGRVSLLGGRIGQRKITNTKELGSRILEGQSSWTEVEVELAESENLRELTVELVGVVAVRNFSFA